MKNSFFRTISTLVMLAIVFPQVATLGPAATNAPNRLTPAQMKNAVIVKDGLPANRSNGEGQVYRLESCAGKEPDAACYFLVNSNRANGTTSSSSILPLSTSATIACGITIYDALGIAGATLKENVGVTFSGTYGQTPVTLNWGDLRGTSAYHPGWSLVEISGPTPTPGWGVAVSRTGTAYATAGASLVQGVGGPTTSTYITTRLQITRTGWSCS